MTRSNVVLLGHPLGYRVVHRLGGVAVVGRLFGDELLKKGLILLVAFVNLSRSHSLLELALLPLYLVSFHRIAVPLLLHRGGREDDSPVRQRAVRPLVGQRHRVPLAKARVVLQRHPLEVVHAAVLYLVAWWGIHSQLPRSSKAHIAADDDEAVATGDDQQRPGLEELRRLDDARGERRHVLLRPLAGIPRDALNLARVVDQLLQFDVSISHICKYSQGGTILYHPQQKKSM